MDEEERFTATSLLNQMKRRRKQIAKKTTKKTRVGSPRAPSPELDHSRALAPETELNNASLVIDLEGDFPPQKPEATGGLENKPARAATEAPRSVGAAAEATEESAQHAADAAASNSGTGEEEESILDPEVGLDRSKRGVISAEVVSWAELSPGQLEGRVAIHIMVANIAIHALTLQSNT